MLIENRVSEVVKARLAGFTPVLLSVSARGSSLDQPLRFRSGHTSPSCRSGRDGDVQNTVGVMEQRLEQISHPSLIDH